MPESNRAMVCARGKTYARAYALTQFERRIFFLMVEEGLSGKRIAARLNRKVGSTQQTVKLVRAKLGGGTHLSLAIRYWKRKLAALPFDDRTGPTPDEYKKPSPR
jgi:DNA-binding NarL/FixJ family response regulator